MRIAHVNDIAFVASTMVRGLQARGIDATLIKPPTPGASWTYPAKLLTIPIRAWPMASTAWHLRLDTAAIVHIHYATQAWPAMLSGRPFVVHCHGSDIRGVDPTSVVGRFLTPALHRAASVLYSTPDLASWAT